MEVDGVPCAINRPVQIRPFATDLHVGFVHTPRCSGRPREAVPAALELRRIMMYPAHDSRVGHRQATLSHHLHQKLSLKRRYHRTHSTMISRSKCRPSNNSSKLRNLATALPSTRPVAPRIEEQANCTRAR